MNKISALVVVCGVALSFNAVVAYKGKLVNNTEHLIFTVTIGNAVWKLVTTSIENKQTFVIKPRESVDYDTHSGWLVALVEARWEATIDGKTTSGRLDVGQQWRAGGTWTFNMDPTGKVSEKYSG